MNKEDVVNIRDNSEKLAQSPQPSKSSKPQISEESEHAENSTWSKPLTWIQKITLSLRRYVRPFKPYMLSSEDDTNIRFSNISLLAKEKPYLFPEQSKEFDKNGITIKTPTGLPLSKENTTPSTSKNFIKERFSTEPKEANNNTDAKSVSIANENATLSDSDEDDSIVIAYLKKKDLTVDVEGSVTRKKISVLEKVPKMETILEELSESSLDVHIPSFPASPRSLNYGSDNSIEFHHDPYFAEAIEFLHEDKDFLTAAETGNHQLLEVLIRKQSNIQQTDHLGRNALHLAVCSGSEEAVKLLLKYHVKTNVMDKLGMTPLYLCLMRRPSYKIARLLFDHGAEIVPRANAVDTGMFLQFVMMCTPTREDADILELLVEKGAIVNDPDAPGGRQAIHFAAMSNNCRLIKILVQLGADLTLRNHRNETPMDVAEVFSCKEAYQLLSELEYIESENSSESPSSVLVSYKL